MVGAADHGTRRHSAPAARTGRREPGGGDGEARGTDGERSGGGASRYHHYRVRITDRAGIHYPYSKRDEHAIRQLYDYKCASMGRTTFRVELIGIDDHGNEHVMEHCELRTDLYANVKP